MGNYRIFILYYDREEMKIKKNAVKVTVDESVLHASYKCGGKALFDVEEGTFIYVVDKPDGDRGNKPNTLSLSLCYSHFEKYRKPRDRNRR